MRKGVAWLILGLAVLSGLLLRLYPLRNFMNPQGGFYFYSVDTYDHLRRITLGVARFPALADFDYYAAFPHGLGQLWAPGFDYLLSALCLLAGGGRSAIETVCFLFPPLAAALAVLAVYFIASVSFHSRTAGVVAAVVLALNPATLVYSLPMNFDHHAVEPLVAMMLFALPLFEERGRLRLRPVGMALTVASLLLAILVWRGSTLYWGLAFVSILGRVFVCHNRPLAFDYALAFGITALLLAGYCLLDPWGGAQQLAFGVLSWFHVLVLAGWAAILLLFGVCRTRRHFLWGLGGVGVVAVLAVAAGPLAGMAKQFLGGLSFVRGEGDPWLDSNSELRGVFKARYSFWYSASYLTPFWFVAPLALWQGVRKWGRGRGFDPLLLNFLIWSPLLAMGFIIRYSHIAGLFTSLAAGYLVAVVSAESHGQGRRAALIGGTLLCLLPGILHYREAMTADLPGYMKYGLHGEQGVLDWLQRKTPPTSHWLHPVERPEYGVLARWPLGALIYQVAQRPALSTAFGWEGYGFYQEAGFWVTEEESRALEVAREAQVRYVLAQAVHDLQTDFAVALQGQTRGELPPGLVGPELRTERTLQMRLMQGDGSMMKVGDGMLPALQSMRLVHESPYLANTGGGGKGLSYFKVFEIVKGAVISGKAPKGEAVILALELATTRQRKFSYLTRVHAGEDGTFQVRVPYATTGQQGDTQPLGDYTLYLGQTVKGRISVSESDVATGARVEW